MRRPPARRLISPAKAPATVPPPLDGAWAAGDTRLDAAEVLPLPTGAGPEDVAVDLDGRVLAGGDDGQLWRWPADGGTRPDIGGGARIGLDQRLGAPVGLGVDRDRTTVVRRSQMGGDGGRRAVRVRGRVGGEGQGGRGPGHLDDRGRGSGTLRLGEAVYISRT